MARMRFVVEVTPGQRIEDVANDLHYCLLSGWDREWMPSFDYADISVTAYEPHALGSDGQHRVADGGGTLFRFGNGEVRRISDGSLVTLGPTPPSEPEERAATCSCYMGATAQPYAHEPSCPVHPRFVDVALPDANGKTENVPAPLLDGAQQDGKVTLTETEHTWTLTFTKTGGSPTDTIRSFLKLAKSLGYGPPRNIAGESMV